MDYHHVFTSANQLLATSKPLAFARRGENGPQLFLGHREEPRAVRFAGWQLRSVADSEEPQEGLYCLDYLMLYDVYWS